MEMYQFIPSDFGSESIASLSSLELHQTHIAQKVRPSVLFKGLQSLAARPKIEKKILKCTVEQPIKNAFKSKKAEYSISKSSQIPKELVLFTEGISYDLCPTTERSRCSAKEMLPKPVFHYPFKNDGDTCCPLMAGKPHFMSIPEDAFSISENLVSCSKAVDDANLRPDYSSSIREFSASSSIDTVNLSVKCWSSDTGKSVIPASLINSKDDASPDHPLIRIDTIINAEELLMSNKDFVEYLNDRENRRSERRPNRGPTSFGLPFKANN